MHLCDVCRAMQPILLRTPSDDQIPLDSYKIHHQGFLELAAAKMAGCYICTRLRRTLKETIRPVKLLGVHPATFYIATTSAPAAGDFMQTTSIRFYRGGQEDDDLARVPLDVFHCVPYTPSRYVLLATDRC